MKNNLFFLLVTFFSLNNSIAQDTPLGNKIVGNGDATNYYIGHFPVYDANGLYDSDGLDIHWYGGIRFVDNTNTSVMQIKNGNVGIGNPYPEAKLDIYTYVPTEGRYNSQKWSTTNVNYNLKLQTVWSTNGISQEFVQRFNGTDYTSLAFLNGNVGIGTSTPISKLQVLGAITLPLSGNTEASEEGISPFANHRFNYNGKYLNHYGFGFYLSPNPSNPDAVNTYMTGFYGLDFFTADSNRMRILNNGNVGIGTLNPDSKLTVNGTIHSTEVKVTLIVPADYVFQKYYTGKSDLKSDYTMPTLAQIESFTKQNNHLPNVPSAKEMQQNGMSLGEMSNLLLQKVEELTLYAIEQNKCVMEQNKKIILQQEELEQLKLEKENYKLLVERLAALEKEFKK